MAITYVDYIDKIKLSEDEVYEIVDTKARSQIITQNDSILSALTNSTYAGLLADNALLQLSIIEDVAGTLDWITSHGAFVVTEDTQVQEATIYFTYNQETGDYDPIVYPDQTKNPHEEGWYVLDITDSQTKFIMAHLAVTTRGLWILPSRLTIKNKKIDSNTDKNSSKDTKDQRQANANARQSDNYKILLSNDGMYIYDGKGREVVKYGSSIDFSGERPFYIGTENAYIAYYDSNDDGIADTIRIDGNTIIGGNVSIGEESKTLSQLLEQLDNKLDSASISVTPSDNGAIIDINGSTVEIMNGSSGTVYYTYIRYSANADGSNMQTEPDSTTIYMGIYTGTASTPPTQASYYKWSRYRGQDGIGISGTSIQYGISNSASSQPSSWQSTAPSTIAKGSWLWTKTITTYTNGSTSATYGKSYIGTDGNDGSSVYVNGSTYSSESHTTTIELITVDSQGQSTPSTFSIKDGTDGTNGAPGAAGYVHFAWANSADGTEDFSTSESEGKSYLGVYTDNTQEDSEDPEDYSWSLIRGADGTGIQITKIEYGISTSSILQPSNWSTAAITDIQKGTWLWTRNSTTYTDSTSSISYTKSYVGTDGQDGSSVTVQGTSKDGKVTTITLIDSNGNQSTFAIEDGTDGQNGTPGRDGQYIHFAWANSADGLVDFSTDQSEDRTYLGVYSSTVSTDSLIAGDYTWTLIKGADGAPGKSISDVEEWYGSSTASSVAPSSYGTSIITPSSDDKYIWNYEKIIYNSDITNFSTTAPHIVATFSEDGTPGAPGQALTAITQYYLLSSVSTTAPAYDNADWTTQVQTPNSTKRYVWNYEALSWNNWQGIENQTTVTRTAQRIISIFGATGKSLTDVTEYYAANNSTDSAPTTAEFSTTILTPNASSKYVWNYQKMDWLDDGIPSITTTAPHIIATFSQDGAPGQSLISVAQYYFASNSTQTPTGNFTTEVLIPTVENKYIWNYELLTWDNWEGVSGSTHATTTNKHIIAVYGDKGTSLSTVTNFYGSSTVNSATPTNYSTNAITPSSEHKYIWNYEVLHWDDDLVSPTTTEQHIIAVFSEDGDNGKSLLGIKEYYAGNNSSVTAPSTSDYTTATISPAATTKYIWNREAMLWDDNGNHSTTWTDPHLISMFSNGISGTTVEYYVSTSGASTTGGSWSTSAPSLSSTDAGKWLWVRTTTSYDEGNPDVAITKSYIGTDGKDGSVVTISTASQTMQDGHKKTTVTFVTTNSTGNPTTKTVTIEDGKDGDKGDQGDPGQSQYTHFAWANSEDGLIDFSVENSVSKKYIGVYADENQLDSTNPSDYSWTLIKGADGAPGLPGADGTRGNVIVYPMEINWETGSAILKAILFVDGYEVAGSTYEWSKITTSNATTVGTNASTYGINNANDLDAIYACTITWSDYALAGYGIAGISKLLPSGSNTMFDYAVADYGAADSAMVIANSSTFTQKLMSKQTGSLDLRSAKQAYDNSAHPSQALANTVSCYYRATPSGYNQDGTPIPPSSTPSKPSSTSVIGSNNNEDNTWEYVMPKPSRDKFFFTCEQYTKVDGTVTFSDVRVLDSETYVSKWVSETDSTYIDGGALYANSVDADRIKGHSITADQLQAGSINSTVIATGAITIGNISTSAQAEILNSEIEIGGINMLPDSNQSSFTKVAGTRDRFLSDTGNSSKITGEFITITDPPAPGIKYGYKLTCIVSGSNIGRSYAWDYNETLINLKQGEEYTLSCYVRKVSGAPRVMLRIGFYNGSSWNYNTKSSYTTISNDTLWQHISFTFTFPTESTINQARIYPIFLFADAVDDSIQACGFKLEKGNKATTWTACPYDIATTIDDAATKATNYITNMSEDGIFVHQYVENEPNIEPDSENANGVHISDSVDIIRNGQVLAQYGQTAKIGKDGQANIEISSQSIVINNGNKPVASYGENIQLGNVEENNVKITSQGISINNSTTTLANYTNDEIHLGTEDAAHLNITPNGITVNNSTKILASYGQEVTLGDTSGTYVNISTAGVSINNSNGVVAQYGQKAIIGDINGFHIEITPGTTSGQIGFYRNANKEDQVAYINGDELNISKTVVLNQMNVGSTATGGQWSWKVHQVSPSTQNNLYLKWLG